MLSLLKTDLLVRDRLNHTAWNDICECFAKSKRVSNHAVPVTTERTRDLPISKAITNAHTGICVCHSSILMTPSTNMTANSTRYHQSGTVENVSRQH